VVHCQQAGGACGKVPAQPWKMRGTGVLAAWGIERECQLGGLDASVLSPTS
jgi:hypothetical protein